MTEPRLSFTARLALAWRALTDAGFAAGVARLERGELQPVTAAPPPEAPKPAPLKTTLPESALQLLGLLQQEGRFVDFLQEDVAGYADAEIGAAARVVHEGCRKALGAHLTIEPVRTEPEGARITLEEGFDAGRLRLTGKVVGKPPFTGALTHKGWQVTGITLPKVAEGHDLRVVAPAEVEL